MKKRPDIKITTAKPTEQPHILEAALRGTSCWLDGKFHQGCKHGRFSPTATNGKLRWCTVCNWQEKV